MSRLALIHSKDDSAKERAGGLRRAGHVVVDITSGSAAAMRGLLEKPPEAFVIDLGRAPSQGRDIGIWLRQRKATRQVPLVFVGGDPDRVAGVRELLPDATYTEWRRIRGDLRRAIGNPPSRPVVREALAGYSGTPLPKKLGIKSGSVVALLGAPSGFESRLVELPEGVRLKRRTQGGADVILLFVKSRADLDRRFPAASRAMNEGGGLWIVWRKKASGVSTDVTQTVVRAHGLDSGFVDYKICAVDDTWSGLLFARRRDRGRR